MNNVQDEGNECLKLITNNLIYLKSTLKNHFMNYKYALLMLLAFKTNTSVLISCIGLPSFNQYPGRMFELLLLMNFNSSSTAAFAFVVLRPVALETIRENCIALELATVPVVKVEARRKMDKNPMEI